MNYCQRLKKNKWGIDFAVGDLHGHYRELVDRLDAVGFDYDSDRLFCTGDLIDRGDENKDIVRLLLEDWFFSVRGNHDQMIIDIFSGERVLLFNYTHKSPRQIHQGLEGQWFSRLSMVEQLWFFRQLHNLPYILEVDTAEGMVALCHAGIPDPFVSYEAFKKNMVQRNIRELCLRSRKPSRMDRLFPDIGLTIHGHEGVAASSFRGNCVWIDTFAKGGRLTVTPLMDLMLVSAKSMYLP